MTRVDFELVGSPHPRRPDVSFTDFRLGRYVLARHLGTDRIGVLDVDSRYARQLLLEEPSAFDSGRTPLYICSECAGLDCGAVTVGVRFEGGEVVWQDFRLEVPGSVQPAWIDARLERTGPFAIERESYVATLSPYTVG